MLFTADGSSTRKQEGSSSVPLLTYNFISNIHIIRTKLKLFLLCFWPSRRVAADMTEGRLTDGERSRHPCLHLCYMLNGRQPVCHPMKEKTMPPRRLSIVLCRLHGDQQNSIPAVCVCVDPSDGDICHYVNITVSHLNTKAPPSISGWVTVTNLCRHLLHVGLMTLLSFLSPAALCSWSEVI